MKEIKVTEVSIPISLSNEEVCFRNLVGKCGGKERIPYFRGMPPHHERSDMTAVFLDPQRARDFCGFARSKFMNGHLAYSTTHTVMGL